MQSFQVANPVWVKYVQLRLLSHYGSEPVCALNDIRIFGKSAADDLEDRLAVEHAQEHTAQPELVPVATPAALPPSPPAPEGPSTAQNATRVLPQPAPAAQAGSATLEGPGLPAAEFGAAQPQQQHQAAPAQAVPRLAHNGAAGSGSQPSLSSLEAAAEPAAAALEAQAPVRPAQSSLGPIVLSPGQALPGLPVPQPLQPPLQAAPQQIQQGQLDASKLPELLSSSSKGKHGGSVYDVLVGELTALQLQHKACLRALADLERCVPSSRHHASLWRTPGAERSCLIAEMCPAPWPGWARL